MPFYKVWNSSRDIKKTLVAESFEELMSKGNNES